MLLKELFLNKKFALKDLLAPQLIVMLPEDVFTNQLLASSLEELAHLSNAILKLINVKSLFQTVTITMHAQ
jgi:hypothetical protein